MSQLWSDPVYGSLARELYRRCGLVFEGGQAQLFRKRVERWACEGGNENLGRYLPDVARNWRGREFEALVNLLTVNETYFFREEEHFSVLLDEYWRRWVARGDRSIRIWSCACSTGCEPYTLAILLREKGLVGPGRPKVEILGTDVNSRVLADAAQGVYGDFSLRNTSSYFRDRYFRKEGHGYVLEPAVRQMVTFRKHNLLEPLTWALAGGFHAVICRNVLIYFDLDAKRRVVGNLTRVLVPSGVLMVGRSESLFNVAEAPPLVNRGGILVHQKSLDPPDSSAWAAR